MPEQRSDDGRVNFSTNGPVAHIEFDRPKARNAMTWAMYDGLADACEKIRSNDDFRVAVLRGAGGKAFVAGTDIAQFAEFKAGSDGIDYETRIAAYVESVATLAIPTVAVVEGWAVGGGMAIASVCDFRIATPGARFGVPIARTLGNCLAMGNLTVLVATLGLPMVKRMLLLAEMVPAEELTANGYVLKIEPPDNLDAAVSQLTEQLASHAPITMAASKEVLGTIVMDGDEDDQAIIEKVYGSADFSEGVSAFVAKRSPTWQGR